MAPSTGMAVVEDGPKSSRILPRVFACSAEIILSFSASIQVAQATRTHLPTLPTFGRCDRGHFKGVDGISLVEITN